MPIVDLRFPNITGANADAKVAQMQSYIHQLVGQLNFALNAADKATKGDTSGVVYNGGGSSSATDADAAETFDKVKALIIKSADIVNAYYTQMKMRFDGVYVAESAFGKYEAETKHAIEINKSDITQLISEQETITNDIRQIRAATAWIKSGKLEEGAGGVYGIEVGERTTVNGTEVFNKYARFTSSGIYFYTPQSKEPIAYMTGTVLNITNINVLGKMSLGGYTVDTANGIAFKWAGG